MKSTQDKSLQLIGASSEILGSSVGAAIGLLCGPVGSVTGAALCPILVRVINKVCSEIYDCQTGNRQKIRAGATAVFAILQLNEKLESGAQIREDGFFSENNSRSSAEEIFEGVIIKSHNEHEENAVLCQYLCHRFF